MWSAIRKYSWFRLGPGHPIGPGQGCSVCVFGKRWTWSKAVAKKAEPKATKERRPRELASKRLDRVAILGCHWPRPEADLHSFGTRSYRFSWLIFEFARFSTSISLEHRDLGGNYEDLRTLSNGELKVDDCLAERGDSNPRYWF